MNNEKLIEIIKAQNDLIVLLCQECDLTKRKVEEEKQRINYLLSVLRKFNKEVE